MNNSKTVNNFLTIVIY